jgi:hypothetical protein
MRPRAVHAVLVGANEVEDLAPVKAAVNAVERYKELIAQRLPGAHVDPFTGPDAKLDPVRNAIVAASKDLIAGDLLVFLFSGHGDDGLSGQGMWLNDGTLSDIEFADLLEKLPQGVEIFASMDCCHGSKIFDPGLDPQTLSIIARFIVLRRTRFLVNAVKRPDLLLAASATVTLNRLDSSNVFAIAMQGAVPETQQYDGLITQMKNVKPPTGVEEWTLQARTPALLTRTPMNPDKPAS